MNKIIYNESYGGMRREYSEIYKIEIEYLKYKNGGSFTDLGEQIFFLYNNPHLYDIEKCFLNNQRLNGLRNLYCIDINDLEEI